MEYGTRNIKDLIATEEDPIVKCNNCDSYYYESLGSKRDGLLLQLLHDEDDLDEEHPYKGCGNCKTDSYLMDVDPIKKPKVMVVGYAGHGIALKSTLEIIGMIEKTHDVSMITPEEARDINNIGEIPMLKLPTPAPIPILEDPFTLIPRNDLTFPKTGREERREKRKKKSKRNRRY